MIVPKYWSHHIGFHALLSPNDSLFYPLILVWEFVFNILPTLMFKFKKMAKFSLPFGQRC